MLPPMVALCEADRCLPLLFADGGGPGPGRTLPWFDELASCLQARGAVGELLLVDGERRRIVAKRRIWPARCYGAG